MAATTPSLPPPIRLCALSAALAMLWTGAAHAFPLVDMGDSGPVPAGTELSAPDAADLRHQLQLANGLTPSAGGGWLILPRLGIEEMLTDNVYQAHAPRRWDLVNYVAPGVSVLGDLPRLQLRLDYAPTLALYTRTGSLNALSQQLNATGLITGVPDLFYIDLRALAGVQSVNGGIGGLGSIGAGNGVGPSAGSLPGGSTAALGLNKLNETQTSSFGISPYLVGHFGDYGDGRLGASMNVSQSDSLNGFAASPFPTGGGGPGQSLVSFEQNGTFTSGTFLSRFQDQVDFDLVQSTSRFNQQPGTTAAGITNRSTSNRQTISNQLTYAVTHAISVFAALGYESINYSGANFRAINDMTWQIGTTLLPNPDSALSLSYGHHEGADSFTANGHYALTARTLLSASYNTTLGTQLENLQNQLNLARISNNGALVNAQTGGSLFGAINAASVQPGLYRFSTFTLNAQTTLDRDVLSLALVWSNQTATGGTSSGSSSQVRTAIAGWTRQLWPDLLMSTSLSYSWQTGGGAGGSATSFAGSAALQYTISETLSSSLRYSYYQRDSSTPALGMYQNLLILGITKQF